MFIENRKRFIEMLPKNSVAIFHSNDQYPRNGDQFFPFRQQSDFFYLTGIDQEKSILIIAPDAKNENLREVLFLLVTNERIAIYDGHKYTREEATEISGIENTFWVDDFELSLREVLQNAEQVFFNTIEYVKYFNEVPTKNLRYINEFKEKYPLFKLERAAPLLAKLRSIKSKTEIELLQKACDITHKGFERMMRFTKPGVYEFEIQAEIDHEFTINRASGHGYAPILASGKNALVLHYITNNDKCQDGDLLLMDFGAEYANYSADMSRTIPVNGKFTPRQKECYNAVLRTFKEARKLFLPGNTAKMVTREAWRMMEQEMILLGLFTADDVKNQDESKPLYKKYLPHGIAHYLGLDVHDVGDPEAPFQPGMVLTCEPGIYIPEENIGIRIENNILVTETEPVDLMENIPIEVDEIESIMNN
jgi:Xaa-Pro aminopeptidase